MSDDDKVDFSGWHARAGDPDTSHEAIPSNITEQAQHILQAYRNHDLLLDYKAYERMGMVGHQRCSDLRKAKLIQRMRRARMPSGKDGWQCQITPAGETYLKMLDVLLRQPK